ncbi:MAG: hypothetical protein IPM54_03595 [Polyangiaceae bacterium]|nr:hypothetical protein [Polyangiaceae bacterium]
MGVHVILDIDPNQIEPGAWAAVYDETLDLLRAWRPRLLGWGSRTIDGCRVQMYTRSIEFGRDANKVHWTVVGDQKTLTTSESQSMYRDIAHYGKASERRPNDVDILVQAADPKNDDTSGPACVFGNKTQGHPYHFAMLAAAMLVEERFPRAAMVWGDIDKGQAERAGRMAKRFLGRELRLPVRVDAPRLIERLRSHYDDDALPDAFARVFQDEPGLGEEAVLRAFPGRSGARQWVRSLIGYKSPTVLGVMRSLIAWLNADRDVAEACQVACFSSEGPRFEPQAFVKALVATWVSVDPSVRRPVEAFRKPSEEAPSIAYLMGSFFLDMEAMGRNTRVHISKQHMAEILKNVFGESGPALAKLFVEETDNLEATLRPSSENVSALLRDAEEHGYDATEYLVTLKSVSVMGEAQRTWVHAIAYSVEQMLEQMRAELPDMVSNPAQMKKALVRVLSDRGPVLTEKTWDKLAEVNEPDVLAWLLALIGIPANNQHAYDVKRALLENAGLRQYAMRLDPEDMQKIKKMLDEAAHEKDQCPRSM